MSYSQIVLDYFFAPRNCFRMDNPDVVGIAGNPGNGPFMVLYLKLDGELIVRASFQTHGCAPSVAAGSLVTERIRGLALRETAVWTEQAINDALGGLPPHKRYCSAMAAAALYDLQVAVSLANMGSTYFAGHQQKGRQE